MYQRKIGTLLLVLICVFGNLCYAYYPDGSKYMSFPKKDTIAQPSGYVETLNPNVNQYLMHSSGKFIYLMGSSSTKMLYYYIYTPTTKTTYTTSAYGFTISSYTIIEFDNQNILICILTYQSYGGNQINVRLYVSKLNIISLAYSTYGPLNLDNVFGLVAGVGLQSCLSAWYKYINDYYVIFELQPISANAVTKIGILKFKVSDNTLSASSLTSVGSSGQDGATQLATYQNPTTINKVYLLTTGANDKTLPIYYIADLSALTLTYLSTQQNNARYYGNSRLWNLGEGIYQDNETGYYWLYFTWVYSYQSGSYYGAKFVQQRMVFNASGIAPVNLIAQNERVLTISPNWTEWATINWMQGQMISKSDIYIYFPNKAGFVPLYVQKDIISIPSWTDYSATTVNINPNVQITEAISFADPPYFLSQSCRTIRQLDKMWSACEYSTNTYIYYPVTPVVENWDITLTWIPDDEVLKTEDWYKYTLTTFVNTMATKTYVIVRIDGLPMVQQNTDSSGVLTFTGSQSVEGIHQWNISIYVSGVYKYNEVFNLQYSKTGVTGQPTTGILIPQTTSLIMSFIPIFCIIGFPSLIFGSMLGMVGFIFGGCMGTVVCSLTGIIPSYFMYLMILIIAMGIIYMFRKGD